MSTDEEPTLGTMTLRDWVFPIEKATLCGSLHPVAPKSPLPNSLGRWFPKHRGKRVVPSIWKVTWGIEINAAPQRERDDSEAHYWQPTAFGDLPVQVASWRSFDGLRIEWPGPRGQHRWRGREGEPFLLYVFYNHTVTDNTLVIARRRGPILHLHWQGQCAIDWSEEWNETTPFRLTVDTEIGFEGVRAVLREEEVEAARQAMRGVLSDVILEEAECVVTENPESVRNVTGERRTVRLFYRPRM